ncbi:ROK family protein [Aestuariibacter salexigens]|uniref:ROK family protein n=1 Tax=Aestuariibacter salexigens TaxID=226010 RepID=UPI00047C26AC|nr:ROK family protein [Aestuariibacter salexigens]
MRERQYYAAVEGGGTKFNCAIIDAERNIIAEQRFPTSTPDETLGQVVDFFSQQKVKGHQFTSLGLGCFGPLDLNPDSLQFGYIANTPKPHWSNTPIMNILQDELGCSVSIDTDVNAAALAEYKWGAAKACDVAIYVTVGTGVGGGVIINGRPLHGLNHPEIGHMLIGEIEGIGGTCPFHGCCVEGLASGTSMKKIWKCSAESLQPDHEAWVVEAKVLARLCHNLMLSFSPQRIILGGGVMQQSSLLESIQHYLAQSLAGYITLPQHRSFQDIVVMPALKDKSGLLGALALAMEQ